MDSCKDEFIKAGWWPNEVMYRCWCQAWRARVPAGHVVVPIEPTTQMLDAAEKEWNEITAHTFGDLYRVMLAASQGEK